MFSMTSKKHKNLWGILPSKVDQNPRTDWIHTLFDNVDLSPRGLNIWRDAKKQPRYPQICSKQSNGGRAHACRKRGIFMSSQWTKEDRVKPQALSFPRHSFDELVCIYAKTAWLGLSCQVSVYQQAHPSVEAHCGDIVIHENKELLIMEALV